MKQSSVLREIIFITLNALGIIYFIALITHSYQENPFSGGVILAQYDNYLGVFGAYIADFSISLIGYSSYLLALGLIFLAFSYYRSTIIINSWQFIIKFISFVLLIINSSAALSYIQIYYGGYFGEIVNQTLLSIFADGLWIIYLIAELIIISVITNLSWILLLQKTLLYLKNTALYIYNAIEYCVLKCSSSLVFIKQLFAKKNKVPEKTSKPQPIVSPVKQQQTTTSNESKTINKVLPTLSLLDAKKDDNLSYATTELNAMASKLTQELQNFGVSIVVVNVVSGPVITSFEVELPAGIKAAKVVALEKDLARSLLVQSVRIIDVIPGKHTIGIEVPNKHRQKIVISEIIDSDVYKYSQAPLTMCLGKDTTGNEIVIDLAKTPHLLVAGATGMGKSVGLNAMLMGILFKSKPADVRLIMIDPKVVELAIYADIPHLLVPVVTDMNEAANALSWCIGEMERRYSLLAEQEVRNIEGFNQKIRQAKKTGKAITVETDEGSKELSELPLIVVIIDEYADMLGALANEDRNKAKRTENFIIRLAQKARAAGIHLIIATQRPSVDVITGLIKSNIPSRVAFKVSSKIDSRTILDHSGAQSLLGMGDMLYMMPGKSTLSRVHGAFVSDAEISRVVNFLKQHYATDYMTTILTTSKQQNDELDVNSDYNQEQDPLYDEAVQFVISSGKSSISSIQRRLRIGYNRAARIVEAMEINKVVGPMNANGSREILITE